MNLLDKWKKVTCWVVIEHVAKDEATIVTTANW